MKYKIIDFTKFPNGDDKDCIAIDEKGNKIIVDPFVGCAFNYENRKALLNTWFETKEEHFFDNPELDKEKVLLPAENDFNVIQKD